MDKYIQHIIDHFQFEKLPVEGTFFKQTYKSPTMDEQNTPLSTSMIGMYCHSPLSFSCFHRLTQDEVWHFYFGDPLILHLFYPDGKTEEIIMGHDFEKGQIIQYTVPAGVWQAGATIEHGAFSVFGCTLSPGFTSSCFLAASRNDLIKQFPHKEKIIQQFTVDGDELTLPNGY
jgi:predicted cupin superfamily sugar epimerase